MKEKVKALSSEAKASAMIIGSHRRRHGDGLLHAPAYIMILFTEPMGHLILLRRSDDDVHGHHHEQDGQLQVLRADVAIVDTLTDPLLIAGVLGAGACFATIVTIAAPSLAEDKLGSRLKEVAKKREELRKRSRAELAKGQGSLQHKNANSIAKSLVDSLNLQKALADDTLSEKLIRAGLRGHAAQTMFYFYRRADWFRHRRLFYILFINPSSLSAEIAAVVGGLAVGFYAPNIYLQNLADTRRTKIMSPSRTAWT
jgi:Flp pilus assembly protein TadB